jgi:hypothetical protein
MQALHFSFDGGGGKWEVDVYYTDHLDTDYFKY